MKPQHQLMLRKVGKGLNSRVFFPGQIRSMDVRQGDRRATKEEIDAKKLEGMGVTKAKRKPLKFKL